MAGDPTAVSPDSRLEDTALVERTRAGDDDAFGELYDRWFDRVYDLAYRITRDPSSAGDVAQDAFLAAWRSLPQLERPDAFGGWLLRITRNQALNRQRKEQRSSAFDTEGMEMIERAGIGVEDRVSTADDPARAAEDAEVVALVWDAVDALGERDAELLDLTLRHGLNPAEVADVVGTNRNAANQMVHRARGRLKEAVSARVLWRGGAPQCGDLADALAAENVTRFGREAMRITNAHVPTCELCSTRQSVRLDPAKLFGAVPFLVAPIALKAKVAHAMEAEGAPMGGSASVAATEVPRLHRRRRRARRIAAGMIVAVVVAAVAIGLLAEELDHGTVDTRIAAPATSTTPSTVVSTLPPIAPTSPTSPTSPIGSATPPSSAPVPTTPATTIPEAPATTVPAPVEDPPLPPPTGTISVTPPGARQTYLRPSAPVLSWSTANGQTVTVNGPGVAATDPAGSAVICPTASTPMWSMCVAPRGEYTYTVTVTGDNGAVFSASATLTIN